MFIFYKAEILFYPIYSAIRRGFPSLVCQQITKSVLSDFAKIRVLPSKTIPKNLDPSFKMDLDFLGLFWKEKNSVL